MKPIIDYSKGRYNPESHEVFATIKGDINKKKDLILLEFSHHSSGATGQEVAAALGTKHHCISGRISELKAEGLLLKTFRRRNKCAIHKLSYKGVLKVEKLNGR